MGVAKLHSNASQTFRQASKLHVSCNIRNLYRTRFQCQCYTQMMMVLLQQQLRTERPYCHATPTRLPADS